MPSPYNKPPTLCWFCKNSTCSGCSWSKSFKPVEGWTAEPTSLVQYSGCGAKKKGVTTVNRIVPSFMVYSCPEYVEG